MKRKLIVGAAVSAVVLLALMSAGLWFASNQLLFPVWRGVSKDLAICNPDTAKYWGAGCGNLRVTHEFNFHEVRIPSVNGYALPGWLIPAAENAQGTPRGAIVLVHAGGGDRREETRFIRFFLGLHLDVLTFDLGCHGEAPCPVPGMTYGERESADVLSAYRYLAAKYNAVYAMGSSVGAAAILIALPSMPNLTAAIAENPVLSFRRLIAETPASQGVPGWFTELLVQATMMRGKFSGSLSAEHSLRLANATPVYFIQSKADRINPWRHTVELAQSYTGPKDLWLLDKGDHSALWEGDHADYENRLAAFLGAH